MSTDLHAPEIHAALDGAVHRRARRRRLTRAGAVAAPLAIAVIGGFALLPAGSGHSPAQALAQAAEKAADFTSGRIAWTINQTLTESREDGVTSISTTTDVRYQGNDLDINVHSTIARNGTSDDHQAATRMVDGQLYLSQDGGQTYTAATGGQINQTGDSPLARQAAMLSSLAATARNASDVKTETHDGVMTYTATINPSQMLFPVGQAIVIGGDKDTATLTVAVKDDVVQSFSITQPDSGFSIHAEVSDLGQPQNIIAP